MNDYQMSALAADRSRQFHAEAQQYRLARSARPQRRTDSEPRQRRSFPFGLGALLGRHAA